MHKLRIALLIGATLFPSSAFALDAREAQTVVGVLERLVYTRGEPVYMDAAEEWLEFDSSGEQLIAAAGFSATQWVRAYDETLLGFAGGIGIDEIEAQMTKAEADIAASPLSAEHKAMILDDFRAQMEEVRRVSIEGQRYAAAVAPVRDRLGRLMTGF